MAATVIPLAWAGPLPLPTTAALSRRISESDSEWVASSNSTATSLRRMRLRRGAQVRRLCLPWAPLLASLRPAPGFGPRGRAFSPSGPSESLPWAGAAAQRVGGIAIDMTSQGPGQPGAKPGGDEDAGVPVPRRGRWLQTPVVNTATRRRAEVSPNRTLPPDVRLRLARGLNKNVLSQARATAGGLVGRDPRSTKASWCRRRKLGTIRGGVLYQCCNVTGTCT